MNVVYISCLTCYFRTLSIALETTDVDKIHGLVIELDLLIMNFSAFQVMTGIFQGQHDFQLYLFTFSRYFRHTE